MPAYYDNQKGRWVFEFSKVINQRRVRARKLLPKGWNRAKAEAFAREQEAQLYDIATGKTEQRPLIEDAVELYVKHRVPHIRSRRQLISELARFHGFYKGRYFDELPQIGIEVMEFYRESLAPASISKALRNIRAACLYAQREHGMGVGMQIRVPLPRQEPGREYYISRRDMIKIAKACGNRHARAIVRLAFYSGMRVSEMMGIGGVSDWKRDTVLLRETKNSEPRTVPLHPKVLVLRKYFPIPYSQIWMQKIIRKAMDETGFDYLVLHDLRHSAASAMVNAGVDLYTVGAVLGHKSHRSTVRYSHLATQTLAAAVRKIK